VAQVRTEQEIITCEFGSDWRVKPNNELFESIKKIGIWAKVEFEINR